MIFVIIHITVQRIFTFHALLDKLEHGVFGESRPPYPINVMDHVTHFGPWIEFK